MRKLKKIQVKGVIVPNDDKWIYDYFDIEATSPNDVSTVLDTAGSEEIEVIINSGGGDVFSGSEIFTALKEHKAKVTTKIVGIAASMGSVIAMAGDAVVMSPTAQLMIHNVWSMASGDYRDFEHESEVLKSFNSTIANAYKFKSHLEESEILKLMDNETWMTSQKALEDGFIDEIMFEQNKVPQLVAQFGNNLLPKNMLDTLKKELKNPAQKDNETDILMQKKAKLNLLKLKGDL